jgi:hypothetical protein
MWVRVLVGLGTLGVVATMAAFAEELPWGLIQGSDGTLYVVTAGMRHRVVPAIAPDEVIARLPEGEAWETGVLADTPPVPIHALTLAAVPRLAPTQANGVIEIEGNGTEISRTFRLSGGNYVIRWTAVSRESQGCTHRGWLEARGQSPFQQGIANAAVTPGGRQGGETRAYALRAGDYYLNMSSGCDWRVTITAQP